jgi:hypothetical protein
MLIRVSFSVSEVSVSGFYAMWFAKVAKNWIGEDT